MFDTFTTALDYLAQWTFAKYYKYDFDLKSSLYGLEKLGIPLHWGLFRTVKKIVGNSLADKVSLLFKTISNDMLGNKEMQELETRVYTNFGEYDVSKQTEFGAKTFLVDETFAFRVKQVNSFPISDDTLQIEVKDSKGNFKFVKVRRRGAGKETDFREYFETTPSGMRLLNIYGIKTTFFNFSKPVNPNNNNRRKPLTKL